jgi:hypothetical protein
MFIALGLAKGVIMSDAENTDSSASDDLGLELRHAGAGLLRYVEDNPLAAIASALIIGVILARFAFLGNPKDD